MTAGRWQLSALRCRLGRAPPAAQGDRERLAILLPMAGCVCELQLVHLAATSFRRYPFSHYLILCTAPLAWLCCFVATALLHCWPF